MHERQHVYTAQLVIDLVNSTPKCSMTEAYWWSQTIAQLYQSMRATDHAALITFRLKSLSSLDTENTEMC